MHNFHYQIVGGEVCDVLVSWRINCGIGWTHILIYALDFARSTSFYVVNFSLWIGHCQVETQTPIVEMCSWVLGTSLLKLQVFWIVNMGAKSKISMCYNFDVAFANI